MIILEYFRHDTFKSVDELHKCRVPNAPAYTCNVPLSALHAVCNVGCRLIRSLEKNWIGKLSSECEEKNRIAFNVLQCDLP